MAYMFFPHQTPKPCMCYKWCDMTVFTSLLFSPLKNSIMFIISTCGRPLTFTLLIGSRSIAPTDALTTNRPTLGKTRPTLNSSLSLDRHSTDTWPIIFPHSIVFDISPMDSSPLCCIIEAYVAGGNMYGITMFERASYRHVHSFSHAYTL